MLWVFLGTYPAAGVLWGAPGRGSLRTVCWAEPQRAVCVCIGEEGGFLPQGLGLREKDERAGGAETGCWAAQRPACP